MRAIVTGMIATYPVGGVAWDYGQYALGLEKLGFEVFYLEDTGQPTYDPDRREYVEDPSFGVGFLKDALGVLSPMLAERWHFRAMDDTTYGLGAAEVERLAADADLFLNVSGGTLLRDAYMSSRLKVLIDTDPGWNHFVNYPGWDASPGWLGTHGWRGHDRFFTYAERIGSDDCALPALGVDWVPTRPPVLLDLWQPEPPGGRWSTVMSWNSFGRTIEHAGRTYGAKEQEFVRVEALPRRVGAVLEVAVGGHEAPVGRWRDAGWSVVDSHDVSRTPDAYRHYIQGSRGEFSVAKNVYAATRSGWFSCRSTCYLAAGRPVVAQDTGFSSVIPTGDGLFAFNTVDQAAAAINAVERGYARHRRAARELAREYFAHDRVLGALLRDAGL